MPPLQISTAPCHVHEVLAPRERPILFSAPIVRALLTGTKTQTRRVVALPRSRESFVLEDHGDGWWPYQSDDGESSLCSDGMEHPYASPYGLPGDRLRVRETFFAWGHWESRFSAKKDRDEWHFVDETLDSGHAYRYCADGLWPMAGRPRLAGAKPAWWKRPAIYMPRVAGRILLEVTGVRVERLQDISGADAIAEGIERREDACGDWMHYGDTGLSVDAVGSYRSLWERINSEASWRANPWVWVVEFRRIAATDFIAARARGTGAAAAFHEETR